MAVDYSAHTRPSDNSDILQQLSALAQQYKQYEFEHDEITESLAVLQQKMERITLDRMPALMQKVNMERFTTADGFKIKIKKGVSGHISKERQVEAFKWLEDNGHGHIIKRHVSVEFGVKQEASAAKLIGLLQDEYPGVQEKKAVHHMTMGAWLREQLENGADVPMDLLGVHVRPMAEIG